MTVETLPAFDASEFSLAKKLLSARVASMFGRKMEEGDWDFVYCNSKRIPKKDWSNLHIDINYNGLGVEHKMLRIAKLGSILEECGTTKMHPAGTRSIRIPDQKDPNLAAEDVLSQYCELIDSRTRKVQALSPNNTADMRIGWLLWKESLDEFLYFEQRMKKPVVNDYWAKWNITSAKGSRKESCSLWIYEKATGQKRYSITTVAGAKIQPYFDVPPPTDENLYYFRVQGFLLQSGLVEVWLTKSTASWLERLYGSLDSTTLSDAILKNTPQSIKNELQTEFIQAEEIAVPIKISEQAYNRLKEIFDPISDEYLLQQFAIESGEAHKKTV